MQSSCRKKEKLDDDIFCAFCNRRRTCRISNAKTNIKENEIKWMKLKKKIETAVGFV